MAQSWPWDSQIAVKIQNELSRVHDKENYVVRIRALKQALDHGLILKKVYRVIEFRQKASLKPYMEMNTKLGMQAKIILRKISLN